MHSVVVVVAVVVRVLGTRLDAVSTINLGGSSSHSTEKLHSPTHARAVEKYQVPMATLLGTLAAEKS